MLPTALLLALSCASLVSADGVNAVRGAMALPQITQGLPLFAAMKARQAETCDKATETPCADGNGCCPSGAACAYTEYQGQQYGICQGNCKVGVQTCTTPITACCLDVDETCGSDGTCTAAGATLGSNTYATATASDYTPALTTGTATRTTSALGGLNTSDDSGLSTTSSRTTTSHRTSTTSSHTSSSTTAAATTSSSSTGAASKSLNIVDTNALLLLPILGFVWEARQWLAIF